MRLSFANVVRGPAQADAPHPRRRRAVGARLALTSVAALFCVAGSSHAQPFPSHAVDLKVGQQAGGAADTIARALAQGLSQRWGQPVVVENKPGAGGILAVQQAAKAKPDGYTLVLANEGSITRAQFLQASLPYDPVNDLTPVATAGMVPMVLVVNPSMLKVADLKSFIALAKASPGKINYASSGIGASHHISMAMLEEAAGIKLRQVPYKGGEPALQDVLGGHVPVMFAAVSTALPFIKDGRLLPLGIGSAARSPMLPAVPTIREQGFPDFETGDWLAVVAPKGTPDEVVKRIADDIAVVTQSSAYQSRLLSTGLEAKTISGQALQDLIVKEINHSKAIFDTAGVAPE